MHSTTPSILVVDDEVDICRNLADIFGDLGFEVDTALNGEAALELVRKHRYDVAFLDLMMPGMDGAELTREVKKVRPGTVTVILTAHPGNPRAEAAMHAGAWQLLPKPIDIRQIIQLIEEMVGQPLVLVVDDDTDFCAILWDVLRERGYRVCLAHNAATAMTRIADDRYRIILLDMQLPDGDGRQVFETLRGIEPSTRVVVVTGHYMDMHGNVEDVMAKGARMLVQKPLDVAALLGALERLATEAD